MKRPLVALLDLVAWACGTIIGAVYGVRMRQRVSNFRNKVHSHAVAGEFRRFGPGASVARDVVLINPRYISMGRGASVGARTVLSAWDQYEGAPFTPEILIGEGTSIGAECHMTAITTISIGQGVLTGKKVTVTDNSHGPASADQIDIPPARRRLVSKGPVIIEDNVWIGDKATILPGVRIGRGAIIAANSVVTTDIPAGCVAAGIPARVVRDMLSSGAGPTRQ